MSRRLLLTLLATAVALLASAAGAVAQTTPPPPPGPIYTASPPTDHVLYQDGQTGRYLLAGEWLYRADPTNVGLTEDWFQNTADTSGWSPVAVPSAFNADNFSNASMAGSIGWYRRDFTLPSGAFGSWVPKRDQVWIVRFESANYNATVWLNGHELGSHAGAYLPFEFQLSGLHSGVNRLVVRVDSVRTAADLPPGPGGQFWNYGGLLREVYLRTAARADLQQVQVRPVLKCPTCSATIEEQALVRNVTSSAETVQLAGNYGGQPVTFGEHTIPAGGTWTATASTVIAKPRLWSINSPQLYKATLTLSDAAGNQLGGYVTESGIRMITVSHGQLELNGQVVHLRGVDMQEQNVLTGAALDPAQIAQVMGWVKALGATMIRSHYPLNPQLLETADRDGILIWDEVPVFQVQTSYLSQPSWLARAHQVIQQNILDNQNHPSIMLWSIGNELAQTVVPAEARYIAGAATLVRKLDPTRPVGLAIKDWPGLPCQAAQYAPLDVIGVNEYFGWFDVGGGVTDDRDALGPFLNTVHACMPNKAIMVTEFGVDGDRFGSDDERGTYAFQEDTAAYDLNLFDSESWLSGAFYFVLQDFAAYPGYNGGNPLPDSPFNQKGLLDLYGNPKPAWNLVSAYYHATQQITPARRHGKRKRASEKLHRARRGL